MGAISSNESRFLYKIDENLKLSKFTSDLNEDFKNSIYANKVANIFNSSNIGANFYNLIFVLPFAASLQKYARFNLFFLFQ